jgi:hypothetical protein
MNSIYWKPYPSVRSCVLIIATTQGEVYKFYTVFHRRKIISYNVIHFCRQCSCSVKVRDFCSLEAYAAAAAVVAVWQTFNS